MAVTWCPSATSSGTSRRPSAPVAPATKILMVSSLCRRLSLSDGEPVPPVTAAPLSRPAVPPRPEGRAPGLVDWGGRWSEGDAYQELRPLLFSIAYRMVGSASEAEDLVQEAYLRFHRAVAGGAEVDSPKALPVGGHDPPGHRPSALGPGPARAVRGRLAAGAAGDRRGGGPGRPRRDRRQPVAGLPGPAGAAVTGAAGGVPAPRGVRLRLRRDRRAGGQVRGQLPPDRGQGPPPRRGRPPPVRGLPAPA